MSSCDFLIKFISHHPRLSFVGLMLTDICCHPFFANSDENNLIVTGKANEKQILEALRRYHHRPTYIQKALYHLFSLTTVSDKQAKVF